METIVFHLLSHNEKHIEKSDEVPKRMKLIYIYIIYYIPNILLIIIMQKSHFLKGKLLQNTHLYTMVINDVTISDFLFTEENFSVFISKKLNVVFNI